MEDVLDWWHEYQARPWGEERADARELASTGINTGTEGWTMEWPYWNPETPESVRAEFEDIAQQMEAQEHERNSGDN